RPILVQQPPFCLQPPIEAGAGEWRHDGIARQINLGPVDEVRGSLEDTVIVAVETKDKAALNADTMVMQPFDNFGILCGGMKALVRLIQRVLTDGFEANEQPLAAARRGQFEQLEVLGNPRRRKPDP